MLPYITVFGLTLPTYGLTAVVAALLAILFIWLRSPKLNLKRDDAVYIMVIGGIGAIIGAKVLYLITVLPELIRDLPMIGTDFAHFAELYIFGGMVFYGGILGGILAAWLTARSYKVDIRDYYPALLPAMALFCGIGRIGCLLAGCCYGMETTCSIGIVFTHSPHAPNGIPLVPTQLIEAVFDLLLFGFLIWYTKDKKRCQSGLKVYLLAYSVFRFIIEFYRGDLIRGVWGGLSTSQWISLAVIVAVIVIWIVQWRRGKKAPEDADADDAPDAPTESVPDTPTQDAPADDAPAEPVDPPADTDNEPEEPKE